MDSRTKPWTETYTVFERKRLAWNNLARIKFVNCHISFDKILKEVSIEIGKMTNYAYKFKISRFMLIFL